MQRFLIPPYIYFQGRNLENRFFSAIFPKTVSKTFMTCKIDFNFSYYKMVWRCRGILTDFLHPKIGKRKKSNDHKRSMEQPAARKIIGSRTAAKSQYINNHYITDAPK